MLLLVICLPALFVKAQTRTIGGRVLDEGGNAVSFATIRLQGAALGVSADASGNFKLPITDTASEIVVSATGFKTQTVNIKGLDTVLITMAREAKQLNEAVVTCLGVRSTRNEFTYAAQRVNGEDVTRGRDPNLGKRLMRQDFRVGSEKK